MQSAYEYIKQIISRNVSRSEKEKYISSFAHELGWHPSDEIYQLNLDDFGGTHFLVEHGLENTGVITFLPEEKSFKDLTNEQIQYSLAVSYNNLVDWQIYVDANLVSYVYNRNYPFQVVRQEKISSDNVEALRSRYFNLLVAEKRSPNLVALDDALLNTIRNWQVLLRMDHPESLTNENLSTLFNALFFIRALEDNQRHFKPDEWDNKKTLLSQIEALESESTIVFRALLNKTLSEAKLPSIPTFLLDLNELKPFDSVSYDTCKKLIKDFYVNSTPYAYNFSLITKHALSQIYQRYVSMFHEVETSQTSMFGAKDKIIEQERSKLGAVYTPHYIAAFFSRFLKENIPPSSFRQVKAIDPACGSGVFLRSLLELQCDPTKQSLKKERIAEMFQNVSGIDKDGNACQAAKLSLTLLYILLTDGLPDDLNIKKGDAFNVLKNIDPIYDAVFVNPPYILQEKQDTESLERLEATLEGFIKGKLNPYLGFLKIGVDILKPGGFGMFVIPHDFLISENSSGIREYLREKTWIRVLADLSSMNIFDSVGSYVVLLIFQKKVPSITEIPNAAVLTCQDFVGQALEDLVENRPTSTPYYEVYQVPQTRFTEGTWFILPPEEFKLETKLHTYPRLSTIAEVREGIVTGADKIFIRHKVEIPKEEKSLYIDYVHDKDISAYEEPKKVEKSFFYPYYRGKKIDEETLKIKFPKTWSYLVRNKEDLSKRASVKKGRVLWWYPHSLPSPERILIPKIMTPHLNVISKFGIDITGKYAVSRSPIITIKDDPKNVKLLKYLLAVLNSSVTYWYISTHSNKYSQNYSLLEPKTLRETPIPNPADIDRRLLTKIVNLVDKRLLAHGLKALEFEREIDTIVADLYKLTVEEKKMFGL